MTASEEEKGERLAKAIAHAGICSRRDAEKLIEAGKVKVDGKIISTPAFNVTLSNKISVSGKDLSREKTKPRLFLFHKPKAVITSHKDPEGRKTVFQMLPPGLPRLISVGRLDYNTEGLLLFTNDGGLARNLELPANEIPRQYRARLFGNIDRNKMARLRKGVTIEGFRYGPIAMEIEEDKGEKKNNFWAIFTLSEGKNREIRKVAEFIGLEVSRLIRISYGPFKLEKLGLGEIREVSPKAVADKLKKFL